MDSELRTKNQEFRVEVQEEVTDSQIKIEIDEDNKNLDSGCSHLQQNINSGLENSYQIVKVEDVDYSHCFETIDSDFGDINGLHDRNQNTGSSSISQGVESDKEKTLTPYFGESSNIFVYKNTDWGSQDNDTVGEDLLVDVINIKQETNNTQENILELEDNNCHDLGKCSSSFENPKITEERNETVTIDNSVVDLACDNHGAENSSVNFSDLNSEKGSTRHETRLGLKPDNSHSSVCTTNDAAYDILGQFKFDDRSYAIVKMRLKNPSAVLNSEKCINALPSTDLSKEKMVAGTRTMDFINKKADSTSGSLDAGVVLETEHQSFQCSVCKMEFKNPFHLTKHMMSHKTDRANQCNVCGKKFRCSSLIRRHMLCHSTERPHQCKDCDKTFKTLEDVRRHIMTHSTRRWHRCSVCKKSFKDPDDLKHHVKNHPPITVKLRPCHMCDKTFKYPSGLEQHMISHSTERPYPCRVCGKQFKTLPHHRIHMVCHKTSRICKPLHRCDVCGKECETPSELKNHVISHSTERPHQCNVCSKRFKSLPLLKSHMIIHSSDNPYVCNVCGKEYKTVSNLRKHMVCHSTERPHLCSVCGKDFKNLSSLRDHMISHSTEKPHQCSVCNKRFKYLRPLRSHMITHS